MSIIGTPRPLSGVRLRAGMAATDLTAAREHALTHLTDPALTGERLGRVEDITRALWDTAAQCAALADLIEKYEEDYT